MYDRFTERAKNVIALAREEVQKLSHDYLGTEHLLLGLLREKECVAAIILNNLGVQYERVKLEIEKRVSPSSNLDMLGEIELTPRAKKVLEMAVYEADKLSHKNIATEHLLLGILRLLQDQDADGVAAIVLQSLGVSVQALQAELAQALGGNITLVKESENIEESEGKQTPALDTFGTDLTQLARDGKLDPVIGRDKEMERLLEILGRRTKNNPILLGEPGVGKTAIVEGLAQRIIEGKCPELLRKKRLVMLDLPSMIAGTKYRGQFEERLKATVEEIRKEQNTIVCIDEIHTLVGAGSAEGTIDASNMLKPELSRGMIQIIGATTIDEYRKHIEKDGALERRFQPIIVNPSSVKDTIQILTGLKDRYEEHHHVRYTQEALVAAAELSDRYIADRFLPDKAIDVLDEVGSRLHLSINTLPESFHNHEQLLKDIRQEKEEAIKNQDFECAANLRDKERKKKLELDSLHKKWKSETREYPEVGVQDIAKVVSKISSIPISQLTEKESERLLQIADELNKKVIGQEKAVDILSKALRRSRVGLKDPNKPIGSFIFVGLSGVGKTHLAKSLAQYMFGEDSALIQLDMSEYMEKFSVNRLIGSPPGYVGYEDGGTLTESIRRRPYSVVLFDEIEKAHTDIFNLLLQILEEGHLTDSFGRTVSFKNTIIIMTSNIGIDLIKERMTIGFGGGADPGAEEKDDYEKMKAVLTEAVKKKFRPEFVNRLDEVVIFKALNAECIEKIVTCELEQLQSRVNNIQVKLHFNKAIKNCIAQKGFSKQYGARHLKRVIQKLIEDPLAEELLSKKVKEGDEVKVSLKSDKAVFKVVEAKEKESE